MHSTVLHIKDDPYLPCSAAIKFHSITNYNIPHKPSIACSCTAQFLHTVKTDHISTNAQYSNCIAATHNITHSPCTSKCTTHLPLHTYHYTPTTTHPPLPHPTAFHNPSLHTTNKHKAYLCKWWQNGTRCRDGVKVLWCHSI